MKRQHLILSALAAILTSLTVASSAMAQATASVSTSGTSTRAIYSGDATDNRVVISYARTAVPPNQFVELIIFVDDDGDVMNAGTGCDKIQQPPNQVTCRAPNFTHLVFNGGDGDDLLNFDDFNTWQVANGAPSLVAINGDNGSDQLSGPPALTNNTINGGEGDDGVYGGAGNDTLTGGPGSDDIAGGEGIDTVTYEDSETGVVVSLDGVANDGAGCQLFKPALPGCEADNVGFGQVSDIENLNGSPHADKLMGNELNNTIRGYLNPQQDGQEDILIGGFGQDLLDGNGQPGSSDDDDGSNIASYSDRVVDVDVDLSNLGPGGVGFEGDRYDLITGLEGGDGDDTLTGDTGNNVLFGGKGNDTLNGGIEVTPGGVGGAGWAEDTFYGGPGIDTVDYSDRSVTELRVILDTGTAGRNDGYLDPNGATPAERDFVGPDDSVENVIGGTKTDRITGNTLSNVLMGGSGNDILKGGPESSSPKPDTLIGDGGIDTADYSDRTDGVRVTTNTPPRGAEDPNPGPDPNDGRVDINPGLPGNQGEKDDIQTENVVGTSGADTLIGDAGANTLAGGAGDDTLDGGAGGDVIRGDSGSDTVDYSAVDPARERVQVTLDGGTNDGTAGVDGTSASDNVHNTVENIIGTPGNDNLNTTNAGTAVNLVDGRAGDDFINTGGGNDVLLGGPGTDNLNGAAGDDLLHGGGPAPVGVNGLFPEGTQFNESDDILGGAGNDTVSYGALNVYEARTARIEITLGDATSNDGEVDPNPEATGPERFLERDSLSLVENVIGGAGSDKIHGDLFSNRLDGGAGDDDLDGGGNLETGELVSDVLIGGVGDDSVSYAARTNPVTVTLGDAIGEDGSGNDGEATEADHVDSTVETVDGGAGDDTLTNEEDGAPNTLRGNAGNDTIDTRDSVADTVDCGDGDADNVTGDLLDTLVNCELQSLPGIPAMSISDQSVEEGNDGTKTLTFTVTLSEATDQAVSAAFTTADDTAIQPADYVTSAGTVTFAPLETTKTVDVTVNGDTTHEGDDRFSVQLSSPVNATFADAAGIGTIINDDLAPILTAETASVIEGAPDTTTDATTAVTLSNASELTVTADYATADGTAVAGQDYTATTGTVSFAPGETAKSIVTQVRGDATDEADETYSVDFSAPSNATLGTTSAPVTITDDDDQPTLAIGDSVVGEGAAGSQTETVLNLALSAASGKTVTVNFETVDGTATAAGQDYEARSGTVTFAPGETAKQITAVVKGDDTDEPDEVFSVLLTNAANATVNRSSGIITITDDDVPSTGGGGTGGGGTTGGGTTGGGTTGGGTTGGGTTGGTGTTTRACVVPNVINMTLTSAARQLAASGCALGKVIRRYTSTPRNRINKVSPPVGMRLAFAAPVTVVLSLGTKPSSARSTSLVSLRTTSVSARRANAKRLVALTLRSTQRLTRVTVQLKRGKTLYGTGKRSSLRGTGRVNVRLRRALKAGTHTVVVRGKRSNGRSYTKSLRLRVTR